MAHIPKEQCKAMDPQSQPCIFVGYPDGVKGYCLLHPTTHELFIERSVNFQETTLDTLLDTSQLDVDSSDPDYSTNNSDDSQPNSIESSSSNSYSDYSDEESSSSSLGIPLEVDIFASPTHHTLHGVDIGVQNLADDNHIQANF